MECPTPSDLRYISDDKLFTRRSMRFFGDTMANYSTRWWDQERGMIELYRKCPVRNGLQKSAFFLWDQKHNTIRRII